MDSVCELKTAEGVAAVPGHSLSNSSHDSEKQSTLERLESADEFTETRVYLRQRSKELLRAQSASDE